MTGRAALRNTRAPRPVEATEPMASRKTKGSGPRRKARSPAAVPAASALGESPGGAPRLRPALIGLPAVAAVCMGLAIFQWMELLLLDAGQGAACSINETFNCAAVWEAPLAKQWQEATGVPVAGWGLIWAALAFGAGLWAIAVQLYERDATAAHGAVRTLAAAGVATSVLLGGYALMLGQVCLTCLVTYALVAGYAAMAMWLPNPGWSALRSAGGPLAAGLVLAYGLALIPGRGTPVPGSVAKTATEDPSDRGAAGGPISLSPTPQARSEASNLVSEYLDSLPPAARRRIAQGIEAYRTAAAPALPATSSRPFEGSDSAPVRIVDFSDLRCPHCARLAEDMARLAEEAPRDAFRLESRYFPLDSECNQRVTFSDGSHVRCTAAKALLCCQDAPRYDELRRRMFREQQNLSVERVYALVEDVVGRDAQALRQCIEAPATAAKLAEDIDYAMRFDIEGTPMVVLNGRKVLAFPPLLMALFLAQGDPNHPGFQAL